MELKKIISSKIRKYLNEQEIIGEDKDISQVDYDWAQEYLNKNVPEETLKQVNMYYILDVSGRHREYITLWQYTKVISPDAKPLIFQQNLSKNFKNAVIKAKELYPNSRIVVDDGNVKSPLKRDEFLFPFGKYRNQNIFDIAETNDGLKYIAWLLMPSKERGFSDFRNIDVVKNPYTKNLTLKNHTERELRFIKTLEEVLFSRNLEVKHNVNKDNKDELININNNKFKDLLDVLKKSSNNSPFISDFIRKIESGADTSTFSEKVNNILSDIYSKSFPKEMKFQKYNEMFSKLTNKTLNTVNSTYEIGKRYVEVLECTYNKGVETPYGSAMEIRFINDDGIEFITVTKSYFENIDTGVKSKISFIIKDIKTKNGKIFYYIKNIKVN